MAKYIEFIGVSGVGKTTTYESFKLGNTKGNNWILTEELKTKKYDFKEVLRTSLKILVYRQQFLLPGQNWEVIERFCLKNPELVDLFWSNFSPLRNKNFNDARFHSVGYILKIIEKLQQVLEHPTDKFVLVDEGLIHNLNYFIDLSLPPPFSKQINKIIDLIPTPSAVVYFTGDINTVIKRSTNRKKINYRDNGVSIEKLKESRIVSIKEKDCLIKAVASKGIPVLHLQCRESVMQKKNKIQDFIKEL